MRRLLDIKSFASGSSGNCYSVSDGQTKILIECGIPFLQIQKAVNFMFSSYSACLISHRHKDHCKGILGVTMHGVDCYAPEDVFTSNDITCGHRGHPINPMQVFTIGTFTIKPFDCEHDVVNFGYLIQSNLTGDKLLYFTDTYFVKYTFEGLNYIMGEANYSKEAMENSISDSRISSTMKKRLVKSHMSIDSFISLLKANDLSKIKQIYLLHLSNNNSNEQDFKERVQKTIGCEVYVC